VDGISVELSSGTAAGAPALFRFVCGAPAFIGHKSFRQAFFSGFYQVKVQFGQTVRNIRFGCRVSGSSESDPARMVTLLLLFGRSRCCFQEYVPKATGLRFCLFRNTNGFEVALLRGTFSDERREINFTGDQIGILKLAFAH
jgi:hypothetical protein